MRSQAERDLEYGNCVEAINIANDMYGSNYWLLEGKKIVDKGRKCLEDQGQNLLPSRVINRPVYPPPVTPPGGGIDLCTPPTNPLCPDN